MRFCALRRSVGSVMLTQSSGWREGRRHMMHERPAGRRPQEAVHITVGDARKRCRCTASMPRPARAACGGLQGGRREMEDYSGRLCSDSGHSDNSHSDSRPDHWLEATPPSARAMAQDGAGRPRMCPPTRIARCPEQYAVQSRTLFEIAPRPE